MANLTDHHDRLEIYKRQDGKWAWRLVVKNNVVATDGNQGYENKLDAQTLAERICSGEFSDAPTWLISD